MLHELEFANLLALHYWRMGRIEDGLEQIKQKTTDIKLLIDTI